jgi:hypothetical protein
MVVEKETGLLNYDKIQEIATREQKNDYCGLLLILVTWILGVLD